ncbi:hypothetical protein ACIPF8_22195 [Collimonas sp. NPDC087041]|uniref:hypothetical protein n=1 Tax=Collimonas sp. NPDC087041 TaxID=3363960 RepID=UPI0037F55941
MVTLQQKKLFGKNFPAFLPIPVPVIRAIGSFDLAIEEPQVDQARGVLRVVARDI